VSQPHDRNAKIPAPGKLDSSLGEFWVENPFDIPSQGHNLSAFERKRMFINVPDREGGRNFLEVSYLSGADSDGDGRCAVAGDFRNTGQMDLVLRQIGGGPLLLYENHFPRRHYLKVSLRGQKSNRLGIGARIVASTGELRQTRELYPLNSFRSQMASLVHFGLADAGTVDRLEIRWPSGTKQVFTNVRADRHIIVDEGKEGTAAIETIVPGKTIRP
jgi:ASPIC and UnbV